MNFKDLLIKKVTLIKEQTILWTVYLILRLNWLKRIEEASGFSRRLFLS